MRFIRFAALLALFSLPAFADINVRNGKISANFTSQPLSQAVQTIRQQSGIQINIDENVANETVSANFKDLPLAVGIKKLLEGTGINYAVIAGADGVPSAVLISGSEKPGSPPKKLDTRPVTTPATYQNRGVVTPINPTPPPQTPTPQPQTPTPQPQTPTQQIQTFTPQQQSSTSPPQIPVVTGTPVNAGAKEKRPASAGVATSGGPNANQQPTAINPTPKFDPNNIPTAGSLVPTVNPPQPQPNVGTVIANDEDDDEDDEE